MEVYNTNSVQLVYSGSVTHPCPGPELQCTGCQVVQFLLLRPQTAAADVYVTAEINTSKLCFSYISLLDGFII